MDDFGLGDMLKYVVYDKTKDPYRVMAAFYFLGHAEAWAKVADTEYPQMAPHSVVKWGE